MTLNYTNVDCNRSFKPTIAVVYTHFPHYRAAVFKALALSKEYDYKFFYDPLGIEKTIANGAAAGDHYPLSVFNWRGMMWQSGAIALARNPEVDGIIFLGNPFILSTWIAARVAQWQGKPVFFWTHGWLKLETGTKAWLRRSFYRLADGLLVYGARARELGKAQGFDPKTIHVINNSLDYAAQKQAREAALAAPTFANREDFPDKPFFLSVSRLVPGVELDKAIEAMALLHTDAALVVVGDGPKREALEAQAEALGVDVRFTGAIYDEDILAQLFLGACAVVSPGKVGLLAMHALAYGAPVITHNDIDRQMPEVEAIEDGRTGAFFRYGDVSDLAQKISLFLERSTESRVRDRAAAIACIEAGYTPQAQVDRITAALDSKLKEGIT